MCEASYTRRDEVMKRTSKLTDELMLNTPSNSHQSIGEESMQNHQSKKMQGGSVMRHFRHMLNMLRAKKTPATAKPPPDPLHILLDEKNDRADVTLAALSGLVDIHNAAMKEMMGI